MTLIASGTETNDDYHASGAWGSSRINDFIKSPLIAHLRMTGKLKQDESASLRIGSALHARFDGTFDETFAAGPKVSSRRTKTWQEAAAATERTLLLPSEMHVITAMEGSIYANPLAACLLNDTEHEVGVRRDSPYGAYQLQCRIDALLLGQHLIDLKTTNNLDDWTKSVEKWGYARQAAFYRWLYAQETGDECPFTFVVVESSAPYRCRVIDLTGEYLDEAWDEVEQTLVEIGNCYETGVWADPMHQVIDLPAYKRRRRLEAA